MMQTRSHHTANQPSKYGDRHTRQSGGWSTIFESPTWLDERPFKEYALKIAQILLASDRPLCTREIHAALGDDACPRWTQDALEAVRNLGKIGMLPTRYFVITGDLAQPAKLDQDREHDRIFEN